MYNKQIYINQDNMFIDDQTERVSAEMKIVQWEFNFPITYFFLKYCSMLYNIFLTVGELYIGYPCKSHVLIIEIMDP